MKTKTPKKVSFERTARKILRDHAIHDAQAIADATRTTQFVYEVPALGQFPFVYIPSGAITPTNGKFLVQVTPR